MKHFLTGLPGGFWGQFFTVMAVIFVLGFFIDFIEISVVVVPIVAPILLTDPHANVTAVWLGVMIGINMQTSFLTPPFGFALFYLRGVAPAFVKTLSMYRGVIPFILMQLLVLALRRRHAAAGELPAAARDAVRVHGAAADQSRPAILRRAIRRPTRSRSAERKSARPSPRRARSIYRACRRRCART